MPQPTPRKRNQISSRSVIIFVALSIVFFILLSSVITLGRKYIALRAKLGELNTEQQTISDKQALLKERNDFLTTPEGEERILREKYDVVQPGEGVIIVTEPDIGAPPTAAHPDSWVGNVWHAVLRGLGIEH